MMKYVCEVREKKIIIGILIAQIQSHAIKDYVEASKGEKRIFRLINETAWFESVSS